MSRKLTKRQRLKRDPANQTLHKLIAYVKKFPHRISPKYTSPITGLRKSINAAKVRLP